MKPNPPIRIRDNGPAVAKTSDGDEKWADPPNEEERIRDNGDEEIIVEGKDSIADQNRALSVSCGVNSNNVTTLNCSESVAACGSAWWDRFYVALGTAALTALFILSVILSAMPQAISD